MSDLDIESYLEAQVDKSKKASIVNAETRNDDASKDPKRDSRRRSSRSRSRSKERRRYRSSSRDRNHRRRSNSRDRDRDRRSDSRGRGRDRERSRERDSDRNKERERKPVKDDAEIQAERELARKKREIDDLTKDQRTILVGQLTMKSNENDLKNFFGQIGKVNGVIMIRDKHTGRHKGIGYVEMADLEDIPNCLLFNNVVPDFQKFPILVKPSEAEKNFVARKEPVTTSNYSSDPDARLYIGNIHVSITEHALRSILEQFGPVEAVTLHRDELGNSKGYAFARFLKGESAKMAMSNLGGLELAGRPLKVGPVIDGTTGTPSISSTQKIDVYGGSSDWKLDDDDGASGYQMNAQSRANLMAKLGQAAGLSAPLPINPALIPPSVLPGGVPTQPLIPPIHGVPSVYLMLQNMFVLEEQTDAGWEIDMKEDVMEEGSKYGQILQCFVENTRPGGLIYLHYATLDEAVKAATALHGRFFGGKMITVMYLDPGQYAALANTFK